MTTAFDPDEIARQVTERLVKKFPNEDREAIRLRVQAEVDQLKDRPIHDYVAVLAERAVKKRLKAGKSD